MKKIIKKISLVLMLVGIIAAMPDVCSAESIVCSGADEIRLLLSTICNEDFDNSDRNVTRLEFTEKLIKIIKAKNTGVANDCFGDVKNSQAVYDALSNGIISAGGSFRPNDGISVDEAVKMVVSALGCSVIAEKNGGYPIGYRRLANEYKLLDNVKAEDGTFSEDDMLVLFYNMLMSRDFYPDNFGNKSARLSESENDFIYRLYKIRTVSGIVTQISYNSFNESYEPFSDNAVYVNGEAFVSNKSLGDLFGYRCNIYYRESGADKEIVTAVKARNKVCIISFNDDISVNGNVISCTDSKNKVQKYKLEYGYTMVYNGRTIQPDISLLCVNDGNAVLVDNNGDSRYDVVFVNAATYIEVKSVDISSRIIKDSFNSDDNISFDEDKVHFEFENSCGEKIDPVNLSSGIVAEVYKSFDGKYVRLRILDETVSGKITSEDKDREEYFIGGNSYGMTSYAKEHYSDKVVLGAEGVYVISTDGNIVCVKSDAGIYRYAYVIKSGYEGRLNKTLKLKLYTDGGMTGIFDVADKITLDGTEKTPSEKFYDMGINDAVIRYAVNGQGKISKIDTCEEISINEADSDFFTAERSRDNSLTRVIYPSNTFVYKSSGAAGEYVNIAGNRIMMIPDDIDDEDNYSVMDASQLGSGKAYAMEIYDVDEYANAKLVVIRGEIESINEVMNAYMINRITDASFEGEWGKNLEVWRNGVFSTVFLPDDVTYKMASESSLSPGCIVRIALDGKKVKKLIVDFDSLTMSGNRSYDSRSASTNGGNVNLTYQTGQIYRSDGSFVLISNTQNGRLFDFQPSKLRSYNLGSVKIARYNPKTHRVETISANELETYKQSGDNADFIVIKQDSLNTNGVFAYKNE